MAEVVPALKIVVVDDDPTGSQTVHSCPLLLRWDRASLRWGLRHPSPLLFLLANTRALDPAAAAARVRDIAQTLALVLEGARCEGWAPVLVSRGDSTLRGHFPLEADVLAAELGPFDATLLAPAFLPGGRTTVAGIHRLHGQPVHRTAFARDGLFAYQHSFLPAWVEAKTSGRLPAAAVQRFDLQELEGNPIVVLDADQPEQLALVAALVRQLTLSPAAGERPRRFLSQCAASWIEALAQLPPQPLPGSALARLRRCGVDGRPLPGLVLVGSHVPLADAQLARLLQDPACALVEIDVAKLARLLEGPLPEPLLASLEQAWLARLQAQLAAGRTPVLATSRGEVPCRHAAERRQLGLALAALMARCAAALAPQLGYLLSKGGITTHTLLADGLALAPVQLQGQLLPGLSLVLAGPDALPLITFPGNLGDPQTLHLAWRRMEGDAPAPGPP